MAHALERGRTRQILIGRLLAFSLPLNEESGPIVMPGYEWEARIGGS
jgi:hypothetical protein